MVSDLVSDSVSRCGYGWPRRPGRPAAAVALLLCLLDNE